MGNKATERVKRYHKVSFTQVNIKLHNINDKDIIDALEEQENKNGFIKDCIRECLKEK